MTAPRHLVTVWNPLYTREVEQHLDVLLRWSKRYEEEKAGEDELYVWWGKVKSPNRQQPLRRAPDIRELATYSARMSGKLWTSRFAHRSLMPSAPSATVGAIAALAGVLR